MSCNFQYLKNHTNNILSSLIKTRVFSSYDEQQHSQYGSLLQTFLGSQVHTKTWVELIYTIHYQWWWKNAWLLVLLKKVYNYFCHDFSLQETKYGVLLPELPNPRFPESKVIYAHMWEFTYFLLSNFFPIDPASQDCYYFIAISLKKCSVLHPIYVTL